MKVLGILAVIWLSLCAFALLIIHIKSHRILRSIALNAVLAFAAILIINITKHFTGVYIPLNWWSVSGCGIFGLPCVCGIILLQILI